MAKTTVDSWNPEFLELSPLFQTLQQVAKPFVERVDWPELNDYQQQFIVQGGPVMPVPQAGKPETFEDHYEPRIFLKGELQTRLQNWHDFFNALVWLRFPNTKSALNRLHYESAIQRQQKTNRSPLENAITLFDECGMIVVSDRQDLLQMIEEHDWQNLFIHNRPAFDKHIRCLVFGHAMYEKALKPYIGMTAHALLVHSETLLNEGFSALDQYVAQLWVQGKVASSRQLTPFPVLGVPSWYSDNADPEFYTNTDYFRPKTRR